MRTKHNHVSFSYLFILTFSLSSLIALYDQASAWTDDTTVNTKVSPAGYGQYNPSITHDGSGGVIITWYDENYDIYAQRVTASGELLWGESGVTICGLNDSFQEYPVIASDGSGGAIIAWLDERYGTSDIFAQWINASGEFMWPINGIPICAAPESQYAPIIISDGAGGAIIAWRGITSGGVYAQRIGASGGLLWSSAVPVCTIGNPDYPAMTSDGAGGVIIAWEDYRSGTNWDIYAQRVDASGNTQWGVNGTEICDEGHTQRYPQVINNEIGEAIFIWEDHRNDGNWRDIYAQRVNPSGFIQWDPENGVPISTSETDAQNLAMINDGSGGAIITWDDQYWVYAQRIYHNGVLVPPKHFSWEIFLPAILKEH